MNITPKQAFIQSRIGAGCDAEDVYFLADLQFDDNGDIKPESIYAAYLGEQ